MHRLLRFAYPISLILSVLWLPVPVSAAQSHVDTIQPLDQIVGKPVATATHLFWLRHFDQNTVSLIGYDLRDETQVVLYQLPSSARSLTSDGASVAWIERTATKNERVQGFDLRTKQVFTLMESARGFGGIALDGGTLVYQDLDAGRRGLFLRTIATGKEHQLSTGGRNPVAAHGTVLWTEERRDDAYLPAQSTLHMLRLNDGKPKILAQSPGTFNSYGASGDYVVWAAGAPAHDRRVYLHHISTDTNRPISASAGAFPVLHQSFIAWTSEPDTNVHVPMQWAIHTQGIADNTAAPIIATSATTLATWTITQDGRIVVTADDPVNATTRALYLIQQNERNVRLPQTENAPPPWTTQAVCDEPLQCGQVRVDGTLFVDNNGRWPVNGVQFFLPQYGINSWTFHDSNYWKSTGDIERWLDVARDQLNARLLRVFVELPTGTNTPTSPATMYDFAMRANTRGMRLGLVLQNSSDFRMSAERRAWLNELITYFETRGALSLIAYASAANEINNWCATQDCYDNNAAYVNAANEWVAQFTSIFRSRNSRILTTVGIATEVRDLDGRPAWYDFFQPDTSGRTLAQHVDFLSPHNYGGGGYGIINDLRYVLAYRGPVVLEEYGFPTDPQHRDVRYSEGQPVCRDDPWNANCVNTAPYFVEWSTRAIRETSYAGGVAWMIADNAVKRCGIDPPDLWTGLFATTGDYCGGTYSIETAQPKATAYRVKLHHAAYPPQLPRWQQYLPIISRS